MNIYVCRIKNKPLVERLRHFGDLKTIHQVVDKLGTDSLSLILIIN